MKRNKQNNYNTIASTSRTMFHTTTNYQPYLHQMVVTWTQDDQGKKVTTLQFNGKTIDINNLDTIINQLTNDNNNIEDKYLKTPRTMAPSPSPMAYPRRVVDFGDFDDEKSIDEEDAPVLMEADTDKASEQQMFANDLKQHWRVIMEAEHTMLITPTPNSRYADFPNKIDTQGLYHRPIYYYIKKGKKRSWRGYWINKDNKIADLVCKV